MDDYRSIIARAVSQLPRTADEARHAVYEQARTALHQRLGNDPQTSDAELANEHHRLEVAIYEVEEDLLLGDMRRFVKEATAPSRPSLISKIKDFVRSAGASRVGNRRFPMSTSDDWKQVVRRNKLLGMWAAEKLGKTGQDAEEYSNALAVGTLDPERSDVLSKIRKDFDAAGVVQSEEQMAQVMDDFMLQAGNLMPTARGGGPDSDALALMLARQLKPE